MNLPAPPEIPLPTWIERLDPMRSALAGHPPEAQLHWMRGLGARQLRRLWALAEADPLPLTPDDLAPADGSVRVLPGKNHLLVFSWFEKRFARLGDEIVGYNETGWEKRWVGPGHFVVRASPDRASELLIDYRVVPPAQHPAFPPLHDNARGWTGAGPLSHLVYGGLVDRLLRVHDHLLIGRSMTEGLSLQAGAFFALWLPPVAAAALAEPVGGFASGDGQREIPAG
jgi:hypothetical protein